MPAPWVPVVGIVSALVFGARKQPSEDEPRPAPKAGLPGSVYQAAAFPPLSIDEDWDLIVRVATETEKASEIPGLRDFLIAVAYWESRGYPGAINNKPPDSDAALRLLCDYPTNYNKRFKLNPWRPEPCKTGELAKRWAYSGGAFQLMPVTALNTYDKVARDMDPARVFDVPFAAAFAADLVFRLRKKHGAVNFDRARAGWASHTLATKPPSNTTRMRIHRNFMESIRETKHHGVDQNLDKKGVNVKRYPGFATVLRKVLEAEGRI